MYRNKGLKSPDPRRIGRFQGTWPTISGINRCRLDSNRLRYDNLLCLRTNNTILYFPRSKSSHECWLGWRGISLDAIVNITKQDIRGRLVRNYRRDIGRFARNYGYSGSIQEGSSMFLSRTYFEEFFFSAENFQDFEFLDIYGRELEMFTNSECSTNTRFSRNFKNSSYICREEEKIFG